MRHLRQGMMLLVGLHMASAAYAVDHTNIDATRPLDFDDANAIAYHEKALEFGAAVGKPRGRKTGLDGSVEYLYGFAPNTHLSLDFNPSYATEAGQGERRRFDSENVSVGVFHNFNREYGDTPALAARVDAYLPTGRDTSGLDFRLRAIASKQFRQYDKLHFNLDLRLNSGDNGERRVQPGAILGYSHPLGLPTSFDKTLVAQLAFRANDRRGASGIVNLGLGMRQQVSPRNVLDFGVTSDFTGGSNRQPLRFVAGYSTQF
jgi:hypothetical protein